MKKLMLAAAIACAAIAAQAESVLITLGLICYPETNYDSVSGTAYLIYSDTLSQASAVAAFNSAGASSYETTIASQASSTVTLANGWWDGVIEVSSLSEMYALCFDKDKNYMYVSTAAEASGGICLIDNQDDYSIASAKSASSGFSGAGWYSVATSSVPEPTSGLLMLLGVAGLALKRKRA